MDKEGIGVQFFLQGFLHNASILKVKIFSKEKANFSIPTNGFFMAIWTNDLKANII